jgi:hypothetical protein
MFGIRMSRVGLLVSLAMCLVFSAAAVAQDKSALYESRKHTFEIGPELSYIKYKEPDVMEEKGVMYGVAAAYIYRDPADASMLRVDGRIAWGKVDYDGTLDGTPYSVANIDDYTYEIRGLVGWDFANETARTTPYIGFGYRYLNDDSSFDPAGYERESNYLYVPLGLEFLFPSKDVWSLGATIEWDILFWGTQDSHLGGSYGNVSNNQHEGYGMRASVRLQKKGEKVDSVIEPFVRLWNIENSEISEGGLEPLNNSLEVGLRVMWKF